MEYVGKFNVNLCSSLTIDKNDGSKWHLLELSKWEDDKTRTGFNLLYVSENTYGSNQKAFKDVRLLECLLKMNMYTRIDVYLDSIEIYENKIRKVIFNTKKERDERIDRLEKNIDYDYGITFINGIKKYTLTIVV